MNTAAVPDVLFLHNEKENEARRLRPVKNLRRVFTYFNVFDGAGRVVPAIIQSFIPGQSLGQSGLKL